MGEAEVPAHPLSICIFNCNSLNLTGPTGNFDLKLSAIVQSKADVILLADTRVVSSQGVSATQRIENCLRDSTVRKYNAFFNSSSNSRGTAILIANNVQFTVDSEYKDLMENYYLAIVTIANRIYCIGAIYGPNNTSREFYRNLGNVLASVTINQPNISIVLGGDWNTTWDRRPLTSNIDVFSMAAVPNPKNSELLENMCNEYDLIDPFRALYPLKRDYTYVPFGNVRLNRSRLDFFVVSRNLVNEISDCIIDSTVSCKLFDHKKVTLLLNKKRSMLPSKDGISNAFLKDKQLGTSVEIAARRVALFSLNMDTANFNTPLGTYNDIRDGELRKIAIAINHLNDIIKKKEKRANMICAIDDLLDMQIAGAERELDLCLQDMLPLNFLYSLEKRCSNAVFFENLVLETKKRGSKMQKTLNRLKRLGTKTLELRLENLKKDYAVNAEEICNIENQLKLARECELRERTSDMKVFEYLNAEKVTPVLLDLAKRGTGDDRLDSIRQENGLDFETDKERGNYIREYFMKLYRRDTWVGGTIEEFLGPDIATHPTVLGSKLTQTEQERLDTPLAIEELDKALKEANQKSAPGIDGFSYRFITEHWHVYPIPLFDTAVDGLENGGLPTSFMTAKIKLIPKKGNISQIRNWRPISLLSNFYKIISCLINSRLQQITDRVLSRAQKGFTKSRQIQEVIINCTESMVYCRRNNIKGVLVSIDQSKAFDSVDHGFMEKVYQFFGFGERIQRWLKSIGTNRKACIQLENGEISDTFNLDKGHAQGDSPSPLLYNLAAQIQIFKIELNDGIERIKNEIMEVGNVNVQQIVYKGEGNGQTEKNESFADDSSNLTLMTVPSLAELKSVLDDFRRLSGLCCNLEKSFVMRIGNIEGDIPAEIMSLGFAFTNKIKLLGFILNSHGELVAANFEKVIEKVDNITRFWERFHLGLTGKISIYKSLLLPQINYVASIITPSDAILAQLELIMERFVTRGLNISSRKCYTPVDKGGLGMFKLRDFIASLQCSWIKRCYHSVNDNWRSKLIECGGGDITKLVADEWMKNRVGPILRNIATSFSMFKENYSKLANNYKQMQVYGNNAFGYGRGMKNKLDEDFFGIDLNLSIETRKKLITTTWDTIT